ncbi:MAG: flagellar basal body-associated FliL family protein [Hyphomonadaceae bacterium]|nr:MAG: flagellar FliL protein [Caulobacteraceae bacterium]MBT9447311.1 flagellar basal body-associated FliL family protein [Hyphomonadaceae bacterium]TPW08278.1 MAG: flagellar FliL protein [Alphaproteobacteria bacterium]
MSAKEKKPPKPPKPPKAPKAKKDASEGEADGEAVEGAEGEEGAPAKKKLAGKTLILFVVLPALLLLGAGGGAAFFLLKPKAEVHADAGADAHGKEKKKKKDAHGKEKKGGHGGSDKADPNAPVVTEGDGVYYVSLPQMIVNFSTNDGQPAFLKLKVTLEAPDEEVAYAVEPELPRIMDQFQGFLRELRMDDISGSAGTARLRLELLRRVNLAIAPAQMNAVLIEEMLVQ